MLSDAPTVRNAFLWLLGGFGAASWQALAVFAAYAALPLAAIGFNARALDLVALGEARGPVFGIAAGGAFFPIAASAGLDLGE